MQIQTLTGIPQGHCRSPREPQILPELLAAAEQWASLAPEFLAKCSWTGSFWLRQQQAACTTRMYVQGKRTFADQRRPEMNTCVLYVCIQV